jgi:membrane protease YdiL (CAAX protease family)
MNKLPDYHFVDLYHPRRFRWTIALIIIIAPFFLNDFFFLKYEKNVELIYFFDVIQRLLILILCFFLFGRSGLRLTSSLAPKEERDKFLDCIIFPVLIAVVYVTINYIIMFATPFEWNQGFRFGTLSNPYLKWLDLTLGLILVSITEELVFRRHVYSYFASLVKKDWIANIIQATLFGLMHWGGGKTVVLNATIFGLIAGLFYDQKKYLLPVIILHTIVNFTIFYILK